ncbi:uncharacterized protein LY79DRAFT_343930 [Colletotrichum navitas]|uniref:Uncharacterized protein n=1 Tax=Colletotrichum navitas TaxID=681940 RepID=A0AAD8PSQ3_9PEZI|nr:uncharacterized protein LY79DRAFT_343930 [Colletotrichum navitas]KAK1579495.1 hypothetical protein LY79DRAFT_343930 [Colletotrichum navitas]
MRAKDYNQHQPEPIAPCWYSKLLSVAQGRQSSLLWMVFFGPYDAADGIMDDRSSNCPHRPGDSPHGSEAQRGWSSLSVITRPCQIHDCIPISEIRQWALAISKETAGQSCIELGSELPVNAMVPRPPEGVDADVVEDNMTKLQQSKPEDATALPECLVLKKGEFESDAP